MFVLLFCFCPVIGLQADYDKHINYLRDDFQTNLSGKQTRIQELETELREVTTKKDQLLGKAFI